MARSDDENDFLHTFTSEGEGKSKSTRIAPLEVGRDEAPARLLALDELSSGSTRTPPSGTRLLHFDSAGELVSETGSGTTEEVRGADDLVTLTGSPVPVGSGTGLELEQGQSIRDETGSDRITVGASDVAISTLDVNTFSTTPRFDQGLLVDEGEAITDDSRTSRVDINSGDTRVRDETGTLALFLGNGQRYGFNARPNTPFNVFDVEGGFIAFSYSTSSTSTGTLSLDNALLQLDGEGSSSTGLERTAAEVVGNSALSRRSQFIVFSNDNGEQATLFMENGELKAEDNAGNATTLT